MIRKFFSEVLPSPARKRFRISSFKGISTTAAEENMPFNYSPKTYNFAFDKGVLETGTGMSTAVAKIGGNDWSFVKHVTSPFKELYLYTMHSGEYRFDRVVAYAEDGKLYDLRLNVRNSFSPIGSYGEVLSATEFNYDGKDGLLFSSSQGLFFLSGTRVESLGIEEPMTAMCTHNDRVFALFKSDPFKLRFSDDFDPSNWNVSLFEGGYISFSGEMGELIKVLSFGGYVYAFFEHGIARISAFNDQTEFSVKKLFLSVGLIRKDTIRICGDRIMFSAADGVYAFDGISVSKVLYEVEGLFSSDQTGAKATFHNGKYYLACRLDMDSRIAEGPNSLLIYDIWKGDLEVAHDLALSCMIGVNNECISGVMAEANYPVNFLGMIDRSGSVNSTVTYKLWRSPITTLGVNRGKKMLREVIVRAEGEATITLSLDGADHSFPIYAGKNRIKVFRPFDTIAVSISSDSETIRITEADLTVDFFGE